MPKTVKVRIAVAVNERGEWEAYGSGNVEDEALAMANAQDFLGNWDTGQMLMGHWITAEVEMPEPKEVAGEVE